MNTPLTLADAADATGGLIAMPDVAGTHWADIAVAFGVNIGIILLIVGMILCLFRVIRGPHLADRALGADTLALQLVGLVALLSMRKQTLMYLDGMLVLSLLAFAGTVAMSQFIASGAARRTKAIKPATK